MTRTIIIEKHYLFNVGPPVQRTDLTGVMANFMCQPDWAKGCWVVL